jgi:hypothetical protein
MPELSDDLRFYVGLATIAALLVVALLAMYLAVRALRRFRKWAKDTTWEIKFSDRQALTLDEFYDNFYAAKKFPRNVVMDVVVRFASAAHAPSKFVKPDDSFASLGSEHNADCEQFAVDTAIAIRQTEERFGVSLFEGKLVTLDDYVRTTVLADRLSSSGAMKE